MPESIIAIGLTLFWPAYFGRRAVRRLEDRDVRAEVAAGREAEPADQAGAEVGDDVAVEVRQHEHVVLLGPLDELHAEVVHDPVVELDVGVLGRDVRATWRKSPSVNFMMFALCTAVTLRRPLRRA